MEGDELRSWLLALEKTRGGESRDLRLGDQLLRLEGLEPELARLLEERWGGFLGPCREGSPSHTVRVFAAAGSPLRESPRPREHYRVEALNDPSRRVVASYHFVIGADPQARLWRLALREDGSEPPGRIVENAVRYLAARFAVERGGLALHGGGVLREGRAYIFAGPSGSGKTTAVCLSASASSLGDDFATVLPGPAGWVVPAMPFDNSERIVHTPPEGLFPLAGIWRLHHATQTRVERPDRNLAAASLLACTAMPWTLPEFADDLLERARRLADEGLFAHLHFSQDPRFWTQLLRSQT